MIYAAQIRMAAIAIGLAGLIVIGWALRGWYDDSQDLAELKAADKAIQAAMARESAVAGVVEKQLAGLRANERVIEREKIKIIDRPMYRANCLDDDGLRLLQAASSSNAAIPSSGVPATPAADR